MRTIAVFVLAAFLPAGAALAVVYVDRDAPGPTHDGTSWDTAFLTIQGAVSSNPWAYEIWVADGVYVENIVIEDHSVRLYGGFLGAEPGGYETSRDQRDFTSHVTTIDGNRTGSCVFLRTTSRVDGFTITNGTGTPYLGDPLYLSGGGVLCGEQADRAVIENCAISGNSAVFGGGVLFLGDSPTITNCKVIGNVAFLEGGGIWTRSYSPAITSNVVGENAAGERGGGIFCDSRNAAITDNAITDNRCGDQGGGLYWTTDYPSNGAVILGNTISGNWASDPGGGIYCQGLSGPTIAENNIFGNQTADSGGGITCFECSPAVVLNAVEGNYAYEDGGGVYLYHASPMVSDNTIAANRADRYGGGIKCFADSQPTIAVNTITANISKASGGGIACHDSSPIIAGNSIANNEADSGAGLMLEHSLGQVLDNTIADNRSLSSGAGINCCHDSSPTVMNNTVTGNVSRFANGGGMHCVSSSAVVGINTFSSNTAAFGGGVYFSDSALTFADNTVSGNTAWQRGGGILCAGECTLVTNNTVSGNTSFIGGGGIYCSDGATIAGNSITLNYCETDGGGVSLGHGFCLVVGNAITANYSGDGGGIYAFTSDAAVVDNLVADNTADVAGGAFCSTDRSCLTLANNVVAANAAGWDGGVAYIRDRSQVVLVNNTLFGNSAGGGAAFVCDSSPGRQPSTLAIVNSILWDCGAMIHNLDQSTVSVGYSDVQGGWPGEGNIDADPLFIDPANRDYHLSAGSACVDAGTNAAPSMPYSDFDGDPRVCDGNGDAAAVVDIGADEYREQWEANRSPKHWFVPGWVWFSIPLHPRWSGDAVDVLGFNPNNRLYGWDDAAKNLLLYPDDFRALEVGRSYIVRLEIGEEHTPAYEGTQPDLPFEWTLPAAGWCWVGVPSTQDIYGSNLVVARGDATRTAAADRAAADPWLNWNWIFWDPNRRTAKIMDPFGGGDDQWLHPWYGYRVWAYTEDVTIFFP